MKKYWVHDPFFPQVLFQADSDEIENMIEMGVGIPEWWIEKYKNILESENCPKEYLVAFNNNVEDLLS